MMTREELKPHFRHFSDGDISRDPDLSLGKRFCSPKKGPRAKRAQRRERMSPALLHLRAVAGQ